MVSVVRLLLLSQLAVHGLFLIQPLGAQSANSQQSVRQLNANPSFEDGNANWDIPNIGATILTRNWTVDGQFPFEIYAGLETKLLRLRGAGTWGQTVSVNPAKNLHILNIHAFRQATGGLGDGSPVTARVAYLNAAGSEIHSINVPIGARDASKNRGLGDGLVFKAWGISVPASAATARLTIVGAAGTDVYADSFRLFEFSQSALAPFAKNLVLHPGLSAVLGADANLALAQGHGVEFWQSQIDWSNLLGEFGSPNQPEFVYQFIPVQSGKTYSMSSGIYDFKSISSGSFGIDYYDASWRRIGGFWTNANQSVEQLHRLEIPAATAHASVWVYGDQLDPDEVGIYYNSMTVQLQDSAVNAATSTIVSDVALRGGKGGTIGRGFKVIYSDAYGLDASSIDGEDAYFTSKTTPGQTFPAEVFSVLRGDGDKSVRVEYLVRVPNENNVASLVIRPNQVKDKAGNFVPTRTIPLNQSP